jgi:hypothetical protein
VSADENEVSPDQLVFPGDSSSSRSPSGRSRKLLIAAVITLAVLLLVTAAGASYLAFVNRERADRWETRANALEEDLGGLEGQLNQRTSLANDLAGKVQELQRAVTRSEGDVRGLERRQRKLANEKAQVEDQRAGLVLQAATLQTVAQTYSECSGGLSELLQAVVYEDYGWINANADQIIATCNAAEGEFTDYKNNFAE